MRVVCNILDLFRTTNQLIAAAGTQITHNLSATTTNVVFIVSPRNTSASFAYCVQTFDANSVTLSAPSGGVTVDLSVLVFHSIQGGPGGQS